MAVGFRILQRPRSVSLDLAAKFRDVPVACVSDVMNRINGAGAAIRPRHAKGYLAGPALTVRTRPGDNLMVHKALMLAKPGDVIVVDGGGDLTNALIGEMMLTYAMKVGVAGVVINGAVRDAGWIGANVFPVFAAGVTHRGPYKDGPGEINAPMSIHGMVIEPGDLIIGDDDGVLCVPYAEAETLYAQACDKRDKEATVVANTLNGALDPKTWVDEALRRNGCEGV